MKTKGVCQLHCGLAFALPCHAIYIKKVYLNTKEEELWKLKYLIFTMLKILLIFPPPPPKRKKNPLKTNQNPSRYLLLLLLLLL
jgi:hypothetical protein